MALFGFGTTFLFLLVLSIWTFACVRGPYWLLTVGHFGVDLFLTILYGGFKEYTHSIIRMELASSSGASALNSPIAEGHISTTLCHLGNMAYRTDSALDIDKATGKPTSAEAMKLWSVAYEPGWEVKA